MLINTTKRPRAAAKQAAASVTAKPRRKKSVAAGMIPPDQPPAGITKGAILISLMRGDGGATAQALAEAVGWQVHSVRGFIAGALKKRPDLTVTAVRIEGVTRYSVQDANGMAA